MGSHCAFYNPDLETTHGQSYNVLLVTKVSELSPLQEGTAQRLKDQDYESLGPTSVASFHILSAPSELPSSRTTFMKIISSSDFRFEFLPP